MPLPPTDLVKAQLMDAADVDRTLNRLARQVVEHLDDADGAGRLALVGMQTRGVFLARRLRDKIEALEGVRLPFGTLDATLYRDDVRRHLRPPVVQPTDIRFDVDDRHLVLVDDVIYTGRTTRAALDALMDLGRPASVRFLAFIDRGLRELPVRPDFVGRTVPTVAGEEVRVRLEECDGEDGVWLVVPEAARQETTSNGIH
ncbi:MAG TPA: bifunctional pyr operon transcriptional regulator/uracil phosphoribosyltransferase PyrR [Rubricoccaceae bacterium]|nr:bifunctional pyr operon transcriptional regulator/uracil phosphoribosyltransferase PyrR [Rubricoccaceae bacterium]